MRRELGKDLTSHRTKLATPVSGGGLVLPQPVARGWQLVMDLLDVLEILALDCQVMTPGSGAHVPRMNDEQRVSAFAPVRFGPVAYWAIPIADRFETARPRLCGSSDQTCLGR
jgi:hypothetical protein